MTQDTEKEKGKKQIRIKGKVTAKKYTNHRKAEVLAWLSEHKHKSKIVGFRRGGPWPIT